MKKLYLHIGSQKTGSTYIQNSLKINYENLCAQGYAYENYNLALIGSGNGDLLVDYLMGTSTLDFNSLISQYFHNKEKAIISSELLYAPFLPLQNFINNLIKNNIDFKVIVAIRNPLDFIFSAHSQQIKRESYSKSLELFADDFKFHDLYSPIFNLVDKNKVDIINFDIYRSKLFEKFCESININCSNLNFKNNTINKSLNPLQKEICILYNNFFGWDISGNFPEFLIKNNFFESNEKFQICTENLYKKIVEKSHFYIDKFNSEFPIDPIRMPTYDSFKGNSIDSYRYILEDSQKLFAFFSSDEYTLSLLSKYSSHVLNITNDCKKYSGLPYDFDPIKYLLLNPLLILSGVQPNYHYLNYGVDEKRNYLPKHELSNKVICHQSLEGLTESAHTYVDKINSGFFDKYFNGIMILDIGYKGSNPNAVPILPNAIGIDKDYPNYNGKDLPFADYSIDTVYNSHCLEHIGDYVGAISEWFRVLKIGGYLVIVVPHMYLYERRLFPPSHWNRDHKRFYTPSRLLREVEETLPLNTYRVVELKENWNKNFSYDIQLDNHSGGPYEIEIVITRVM